MSLMGWAFGKRREPEPQTSGDFTEEPPKTCFEWRSEVIHNPINSMILRVHVKIKDGRVIGTTYAQRPQDCEKEARTVANNYLRARGAKNARGEFCV